MSNEKKKDGKFLTGIILTLGEMSDGTLWEVFSTKMILGLTGVERLKRMLFSAGCDSVIVIRAPEIEDSIKELESKGVETAVLILADFLCHEYLLSWVVYSARRGEKIFLSGLGAKTVDTDWREFLEKITSAGFNCKGIGKESPTWRVDYSCLDKAEKQISKLGMKPFGAWFCNNVVRKISIPFSRLLSKTSIKPRHLLWVRLAGCLVAAFLIAFGRMEGYFLFFVSMLLDLCDGEVARIRIECNKKDGELDAHLDHIIYTFTFASVGMAFAGIIGLIFYGLSATILLLVEFGPLPKFGHPSISSAFSIVRKGRPAGVEVFNLLFVIAGMLGSEYSGVLVIAVMIMIALLRIIRGFLPILTARR